MSNIKQVMSKSTPINQLPSNPPSALMIDDENDETINEVLSQLGQNQGQSEQQPQMLAQQQFSQQMPSQMQLPQQFQQQMPMNMVQQMPPQQMFNMPYQPQDLLIHPQQQLMGQYNTKQFFDADVKGTLLVIAIVIAVQVFPVEQFVFKYVSIEHIPFSVQLIKAVFAGALFLLSKRYIL